MGIFNFWKKKQKKQKEIASLREIINQIIKNIAALEGRLKIIPNDEVLSTTKVQIQIELEKIPPLLGIIKNNSSNKNMVSTQIKGILLIFSDIEGKFHSSDTISLGLIEMINNNIKNLCIFLKIRVPVIEETNNIHFESAE